MIAETHSLKVDERYLKASGLDPASCIYFDIETTGLKAETSHLYLIGYAVRIREGAFQVVQLFAEETAEEGEILGKFREVCSRYQTVIHFNGDRFDIPYLEKKYQEHGMDSPFKGLDTIDIYRRIRPYKGVLGLEHLNQKSVERFLGIRRKDPYDGGQLIDVYRFYRDHLSPDPEADLRKLMLHNYEDVLGMFSLTELLSYSLAMEAGKREDCPVTARLRTSPLSLDGEKRQDRLELNFSLPVPVPVPVTQEEENYEVSLSGSDCQVSAYVREDRLSHFFEDYKNYYYLPEEDRAIHKSVAQFVDTEHKVRAKADNCYVKKQGRFLPVPAGARLDEKKYPVFKESRKDKWSFVELTDRLLESLCGPCGEGNSDAARKYLELLLGADSRKRKGSRKENRERPDKGDFQI